ncbi:protein CNPPD1 [Trichonephila inaurata madagascariensis]|uniref:Protein CNPPD1 n=1 Tax=Trichonephila inaurata madagascariensis TaxID=2747483 RepID=A0A8X6IED9_9ARAC|nr:protein CNPPD1 [Trichonephila inaurata madagascariensis]
MRAQNYTSLPSVTNLLSKSCLCSDFKDSPMEHFSNNCEEFDEDMYDELEEVFSDHLRMKERLQKTLYAGGFDDLDDLPDHPPLALTGLALELFSKAVPNYGLDILDMDFVSTTSEAARISPCAMIIAMIYLERLQIKNSEYLENVSPPGLFVVTMLVASKFLFEDEEDIVTNQMWAEVLNLDVKELNKLEHDFLSAIDWRVFVNEPEYSCYLNAVEKLIAVKQSSLRNWASYSDINVIVQSEAFRKLFNIFLKKFLKMTVLWTLGYVATAVILYCTGLALQKLKSERVLSQDFMVQNNTIDLQTSVQSSVDKTHVSDQMSSNIETSGQDSTQPLFLILEPRDNLFGHANQNRNNYSYCLVAFKKKSSAYKIKTRPFSPHRLEISSGDYFTRKTSVLNDTFADHVARLKIRQFLF